MYEVSNWIAVNQTMHGKIMTCINKPSCVQQRENTVAINLTGFFFDTV
jgi:hypothetical protein